LALVAVSLIAALDSSLIYEQWYRRTLNVLQWNWAYGFHTTLFVGIALVLGSLEFKACIPSVEVAITRPVEITYIALNIYARRRMWFWIGILYTIPMVITLIRHWLVMENSTAPVDASDRIYVLSNILYVIAFSCFAVEAQSYLMRLTITRRSFSWLLLLPILAWPAFVQLYYVAGDAIWESYSYYIHSSELATGLYESQRRMYMWIEISLAFVLLAFALVFSAGKLKPPAGFRGTYED